MANGEMDDDFISVLARAQNRRIHYWTRQGLCIRILA